MANQNKFTRPSNPFTDKIVKNITIKTNSVLGKFPTLADRDGLCSDISSRLTSAVMKAYAKFKDNDKCSYESFVNRCLDFEVKHCIRDYGRRIHEMGLMATNVYRNDEDGEHSFLEDVEDPHNFLEESIDRLDFADIISILQRKNSIYARIFTLRHEGFSLSEIATMQGIDGWELYDILWPAICAEVKNIYNFQKSY